MAGGKTREPEVLPNDSAAGSFDGRTGVRQGCFVPLTKGGSAADERWALAKTVFAEPSAHSGEGQRVHCASPEQNASDHCGSRGCSALRANPCFLGCGYAMNAHREILFSG